MERRTGTWIPLVCTLLGLLVQGAQAQESAPPTPQERVEVLKQSLERSQKQLRAYEWIATTVVAKGGEEKSRRRHRCYYDVDGKLHRVPVGASGPEDASGGRRRGLRRRIAEQKKQEMTDYLKSAAALVHSYVPPNPGRIQHCVNTGKLSLDPVEPGRRVRLDLHDYMKAGDVVGIEMELPTNRPLGMQVSSYLDSPEDGVVLKVEMGVLPDGTIYAKRATLDAKAKEMTVTVENSGYRRTGD